MARAYNLTIRQGETFTMQVTVERSAGVPWDLDTPGTTITAKGGGNFGASATITFTATKTNAAAGIFTLSLTATQTAALAVPSSVQNTGSTREVGLGPWDCELLEGATVTRILEGVITLSQEKTV